MQYRCVRASECMNLVWSDLAHAPVDYHTECEQRQALARYLLRIDTL